MLAPVSFGELNTRLGEFKLKINRMKNKSNAGRKKSTDKKMTVALMIHKSDIVGVGNMDIEVKDDNGVWNPDYLECLEQFKQDVMDFVTKRRGY
jgi:hypothetical protein